MTQATPYRAPPPRIVLASLTNALHLRPLHTPVTHARFRYQHWTHQPRYDAAEHEFRRKQVIQQPLIFSRFEPLLTFVFHASRCCSALKSLRAFSNSFSLHRASMLLLLLLLLLLKALHLRVAFTLKRLNRTARLKVMSPSHRRCCLHCKYVFHARLKGRVCVLPGMCVFVYLCV